MGPTRLASTSSRGFYHSVSLTPRSKPAAIRRVLGDCRIRFLLAALLLSAGCRRAGVAGAAGGPVEAAVPVAIAAVEQREVPIQIRAIGTIEAYRTVLVKSQVQGELTEVRFQEGQLVKAGDVLLLIDSRPSEAALRLAEATLAKDIALAKDDEAEAARLAGLFGQEAAAQRESEHARAAADAAWAQVDADRAAVDQAKLNLEYCTIRAPFDAFAGSQLVYKGAILKARETDLVKLNQVSPIYAAFAVPEQHLASIKVNNAIQPLEVEAEVAGETGPPERGVLTFIDNEADRTTGTIRLKGTFANEDHRLWPGQFVNVVLILAREQGVIVVPTQAIQTGQAGQYVFVVREDSTVEMRPVRPIREADGWTVVNEGVRPGETVVTDGQLRLVPGTKVQRKTEGQPNAATRPAAETRPAT